MSTAGEDDVDTCRPLRRQRKSALPYCGAIGADVSIKETEIQSSDEFQSNTLRYTSKLSCPKGFKPIGGAQRNPTTRKSARNPYSRQLCNN